LIGLRALLVRWHPAGDGGALTLPMLPDRSLSAAGGESRSMASIAGQRWAEIAALAVAAVMVAYMLHLYTRFALPPGTDSGQWLAVSRFYLSEHVPAGRSVATVPPVVPVVLAGFSLVTGTTGAIVAMAAVSYGALSLMAFNLGRRLCGSATAGLLAVVAIGVIQSQLFELFSMGAFPQISAVIGMAVALYALLALVRHPDDGREWLTLAGGVAVTLFSHTPSSTVLLPVLAICLLYVAWSSGDLRRVFRNALTTVGPVFALWCVFLIINRNDIFGYASVPAAYDLKGPQKLFDIVWKDNAQRIVFGAGLATVFSLPWLISEHSGRRIRGRPSVLLAIWTATLLAIVAATAYRHIGTDYPRFIAYFIVPLGLGAAACVHSFQPSRSMVIGILVPVLVFAGNDGFAYFDTATRFYGMNERSDDLTRVADWLNTAGEGGVIGGTRETKWLEALTGRDSLLYLPRIYITRQSEIDRAIQAEVVFRANGGIETGHMLITANDGGQDYGKVFPTGVRVDVFAKGLYTHAFTLRDKTAEVTLSAFGREKLSLAQFRSGGTRAWHDASGEHLATTFTRADKRVSIVRVVSATDRDLTAVTVDYYIGTPPGVTPDSLRVGTGDTGSIEVRPGDTTFFYPMLSDGSFVEVEAKTSWLAGATPPQDANPFLVWRRATVRLDAGGGEQRTRYTQLYDPQTLLKDNSVRYIVDRNGDGASFPILRQLSLKPVYTNQEYSVYELPRR
jgi:hypothetical protein